MTVAADPSRTIKVTDGVATAFPFDFQIIAETDLLARFYPTVGTPSDLTLSVDFTVSAGPWPEGGTLTTIGTPLAAGELVLYRSTAFTQDTDLVNNSSYNADVYESALDNLMLLVQELKDGLDRAVVQDLDTTITGLTLPAPSSGVTIVGNTAEDGWEAGPTADEVSNAQTYANNASSSASASASSASAALTSENNAETHELKAQDWAEELEDVEVETGKFSALHWAAKALASSIAADNKNLYRESLAKLIHPDQSKGLAELQSQGVLPSSFNQQWGGMGYGGLPDGSIGESATNFLAGAGASLNIANVAGSTYIAQGFKVGQTTDLASVWVKVYKIGNPTNNLELYIYDDSAGDPNAIVTNGTATAQSGKLHTDNTDGEWVKFVFPTAPNVTGGTQYHIVLKSSGAVDASNYWIWFGVLSGATYPHGFQKAGDATPTWTDYATRLGVFLVEPATTILNAGLNSSFAGSLLGYEGATLDQSGGFYFANEDLNHKRGLFHLAGAGWDKDKTFFDSGIGTDNNRIVVRCNATTGYAQVDLYEDNETKHTVTGTTDISTGNHIVSIGYRAEADGSDFLYLYIDGASEGTPITAATITLDESFLRGHSHLGGGFPVAPTWTDNEDMSVLPSASGWTWTGTATEANAMVVSGGILYQNGAGYASTNTGYYAKTTTLNNATGWVVEAKVKVKNSNNGVNDSGVLIQVSDGTKTFQFDIHEYFVEDAVNSLYYQHDCTQLTTITIRGKGSDFSVYINGSLAIDGTGLLTSASGTNAINFGDNDGGAGDNATAEWHYFKYYEGAHLPEYSTMQCSELAMWNDDKSALLTTIYNAGTIQSVKTLAGMNNNYVDKKKQVIRVQGITSAPSTTSSSYVVFAEMEVFCFGEGRAVMESSVRNDTANSIVDTAIKINGTTEGEAQSTSALANSRGNPVNSGLLKSGTGLHYVSGVFAKQGGTTVYGIFAMRTLTTESS